MPAIESLLSVNQVSRLVHLSPRTIWRMLETDQIPAPIRLRRQVRFRASEIDRWIKIGCPDRRTFEREGGGHV